MYVRRYVYIYIYVCVCVSVCLHVCVCVCVCVSVCVCKHALLSYNVFKYTKMSSWYKKMQVSMATCDKSEMVTGRKEMFYLTTHSTHFYLRLYGVRHMVKDHSDSEKGNPLPPHRLLFLINSKGSFICTIPQTDLCYTSCGALVGTRNSSMGPPHEGSIQRPIAP